MEPTGFFDVLVPDPWWVTLIWLGVGLAAGWAISVIIAAIDRIKQAKLAKSISRYIDPARFENSDQNGRDLDIPADPPAPKQNPQQSSSYTGRADGEAQRQQQQQRQLPFDKEEDERQRREELEVRLERERQHDELLRALEEEPLQNELTFNQRQNEISRHDAILDALDRMQNQPDGAAGSDASQPEPQDGISPENDDDIIEEALLESASEEAPRENTSYKVQSVFYGTNRARKADAPPTLMKRSLLSYDFKRGDALILGRSDITIPKNAHKFGEIERPKKILFGTIQIQRERREKHFTEFSTHELSEAAFLHQTSEIAQAATTYEKTAFVFIHGFRVTMQNAIYRAAQMAFDLNFDGPVYAFSWPAVGKVSSYVTDMDSALLAVPYLDAFLDLIARTDGVERIHLVSHSMGNALLSHLFLRAETQLRQRNSKLLDQLILAAPDIDRAVFETVAKHMVNAASQITLYASGKDKALVASRSIRNQNPRAGDVPKDGPVIVDGVDTIDATAVSTDVFGLNHSGYAEDRTLIDDLGRLMKSGARVSDRFPTIETVTTRKGPFYRIKV